MSDIKNIGVVGAGQMGRGIAQVAASSGLQIKLADVDQSTAQSGKETIAKSLEKLVTKEKISTSQRDNILEHIVPVSGVAELKGCEMAIEAATENQTLKREIFSSLAKALGDDLLLATNTSSISITWLAAAVPQPERVVGMHFMNPVPVMKLVEVIRGLATDDATYQATVGLAQKLGKEVVTSNDYPGFIVNRILMPMINEAAFAVMEGVASIEDVDKAMKLGTNQPMGPLTLADFIGLDTCLAILDVMHNNLGDPKYRPCPLLKQYVDAGRVGRKVGRGFYQYA